MNFTNEGFLRRIRLRLRLTKKNEYGYIDTDEGVITGCSEKLGQLEDLEEELGVDLITLFDALKNGIYGTMYGETIDNLISSVIKIEPKEFKLCLFAEEPCFYFVWGWPGPDYNIYKLKDYGKTWALTKEELL